MSQSNNLRSYAPSIMIFAGALALAIVSPVLFETGPFTTILSEQTTTVLDRRGVFNDDRALVDLQRAIRYSPDNCYAREFLALWYFQRAFESNGAGTSYDATLADRSIQEYRELIARCSGSRNAIEAQFMLSDEYRRMHHYELALEEISSFVDAKPRFSSTVFSLSAAYLLMTEINTNLGRPQQAFAALKQSVFYEQDYNRHLLKVDQLNSFITRRLIEPSSNVPGKPSAFGRYMSAAKTNDGIFHLIAAAREDPYEVTYATSQDLVHWLVQRILSVDNDTMVALALDENQGIHIAYKVNTNSIFYANSSDSFVGNVIIDGSKAQPPVRLPNPNLPTINAVQITVDSLTRAHIVWTTGSTLGYSTIYSRQASNPIVIATDAAFPDIKTASPAVVYVVYNNAKAFPYRDTNVWFIESKNDRWGSPLQLSTSGMWAGAASLAVTENGTVHVVYITGQNSNDVRLMHVSRGTDGHWTAPAVVGDNDNRPWIPGGPGLSFGGRTAASLVSLPENGLVVVWRGSADKTGTPILTRTFRNGAWGKVLTVGEVQGQDYRDSPSIVASTNRKDNAITIVWPEFGQVTMHDWQP